MGKHEKQIIFSSQANVKLSFFFVTREVHHGHHVAEFVVAIMISYDGKSLKFIIKGDFDNNFFRKTTKK